MVRTRTSEVALDHRFEVDKNGVVNSKLPLEIQAHLALHLVDFAKVEHALSDD